MSQSTECADYAPAIAKWPACGCGLEKYDGAWEFSLCEDHQRHPSRLVRTIAASEENGRLRRAASVLTAALHQLGHDWHSVPHLQACAACRELTERLLAIKEP